MQHHLIRALVSVLILPWVAIGQPGIGEPAPALSFDAIVQAPEGQKFDWESMRGKVVVLEFWATWCGPCMPALKHLESVSQELDDVPHAIVAVAVEEETRLRTFLSRNDYQLWFVTDEDRDTFDAYGLVGVPFTVIVDPLGRVAALTSPDEINAEVIRRVARGEPAGVKSKAQRGVTLDWAPTIDDEGGEVFASVVIAEADPEAHGGGHRFVPGSGKITGDGAYLGNLIQLAYDFPNSRIIDGFGPWTPEESKYRFYVKAPGGDDDLARLMLARSIELKFGFTATRQLQEKDCYFLRLIEGTQPLIANGDSQMDPPKSTASGGSIALMNSPIGPLRRWSENMMGRPVIDETGLRGFYDLELEWVGKEGFHEALERIGLELVAARSEIEMLVIEPRAKAGR